MKGKIKIFMMLALVILVAVGCTAAPEVDTTAVKINVATLAGPTGMGMAKMIEDVENKESAIDAEFIVTGSADQVVGKIINGELDIACVPTNLAAVLYNKTGGKVQLAAVNTLSVLYIVENGESIHSVADLAGKKIASSGQGAVPEYVLQYVLDNNDIEADVSFSMEHTEVAGSIATGDADLALLPQPFVTTAMMKNKDARIAIDMNEEWKRINGEDSELAMGVIIINKEFAEQNKAIVTAFLEEYKESVDFVNEETEEASTLIEKHGILPNAAIAKAAIPYSNIVYMDAQESINMLDNLFQVLFDFNPASVGGKLPDEAIYYKK